MTHEMHYATSFGPEGVYLGSGDEGFADVVMRGPFSPRDVRSFATALIAAADAADEYRAKPTNIVEELGLKPGDRVETVNRGFGDYLLTADGTFVSVENGSVWPTGPEMFFVGGWRRKEAA